MRLTINLISLIKEGSIQSTRRFTKFWSVATGHRLLQNQPLQFQDSN